MTTRERILTAVARNQPKFEPLPFIPTFQLEAPNLADKFMSVAVNIGSRVFEVADYEEVQEILHRDFSATQRVISTAPQLAAMAETSFGADVQRHQLENVDLAIVNAYLGVAENSAVWLTEENLCVRVVPFICQHLAVILPKKQIVPLMHDAYSCIGPAEYGYGVFIAGPSKTADIEQSLVLGAHGPRTMTVFLMA